MKIRKIMNDFSTKERKIKFTEALHIHIQDKNYREAQRVKESKAK